MPVTFFCPCTDTQYSCLPYMYIPLFYKYSSSVPVGSLNFTPQTCNTVEPLLADHPIGIKMRSVKTGGLC